MANNTKYEQLFSPKKIGNLEISNRVVMTPMEVGLAKFNGNPSKETIDYFYARAKGGTGLIMTGITRVDNWTGVSTPRQLSLANHFNIRGMRKLTRKIHETDTKIFVQLHHPGRQNYSALMYDWPMMMGMAAVIPGFSKIFGGLVKFYNGFLNLAGGLFAPSVVAPSAIPCQFLKTKTRALAHWEIKSLEKKFIKAAYRAKQAGFDGVELHAAHGYLIQQFLSPRTNKRTDEYGGSFENRLRFLKNILLGVKSVCGADFPVSVRLSVEEFYTDAEGDEKGIILEEGVAFAKEIEKLGADALNISSATYETMNQWLEPVTYQPGWRKFLAAAVKKEVSIPVIAANLIRSPEQAEQQLSEGTQDFIGLGRPLIVDPNWANKAKKGQEAFISTCINCLNCFETLNANAWVAKPLECAINPFIGHEIELEQLPAVGQGKKAVVVGAGVAGLKAAELLAREKYSVVVLEKEAKEGGQVYLASLPPHKERLFQVVTDLKCKCDTLGVQFVFNKEATPEAVSQYKPDKIVLAAGSIPFMPPIPGRELPHVFSVNDVLTGKRELKDKKVVVAGSGLTGLETAEFLAAKGNKVTVIEMMDRIGPTAYHQNLDDVMEHLQAFGAQFMASVKLQKISATEVTLFDLKKSEELVLPCDAVVLSLGSRKNDTLFEQMKAICPDVEVIGDCCAPGKIAHAVKSAMQKLIPN